jgi:hypothetical protein
MIRLSHSRLASWLLVAVLLIALPAGLAHAYANGELDSDHGCIVGHFLLLTVAALLSVALPTLSIVPIVRLICTGLPVFDIAPLFPSSTRAPPV